MWRRTYLVLLLIRVYFALSPSYIHPDEHFQGLEVFAGKLFVYRPVFRPKHGSGLGHLTMRRATDPPACTPQFELCIHYIHITSKCLHPFCYRPDSFLSVPVAVGVHLRSPYPQRLSAMADL